ncbi:MAG: EAL domain-containing protein [Methylophilus sp.]|nr:EAL domain-containing protein [Methylophilus sp.]
MKTAYRSEQQSFEYPSELLNKLTQHLHGFVYQFCMTPDGAYSMPFASQQIEQIFGYRAEEVMADASKMLAMTHSEDLEKLEKSIELSAKNMSVWECEWRILQKDGTELWLYGSSTPELQADGSILWTGYIKDITENKQLREIALMGSLALEAKPGAISDLLFEIDADCICTLVHSSASEILLSDSESIKGQSLKEFLPESGLTAILLSIDEAKRLGRSFGRRFFVELLQGTRWFEVTVNAKKGGQHDSQFIILVRDMTERKKAEDALYIDSVVFRSITQGIVLTNPQLSVIAINDAYTQMTGYTLNEIVGGNACFMYGEKTNPGTIEEIHQAIYNQQEYFGEILYYRKDGSSYWCELTIRPIFNESQQLTNYLGVMRDISERQIAQEKLLKTQKSLVESNERYMDLYEFAPIGYVTLSEAGMISEANWKARSILGIKRKDLGKERFARFVVLEDRKKWQIQFSALRELSVEDELAFELKLINDVANQYIDVKLSCVRTVATENHSMVRVTLFDITEMKQADLSLRQKEAYQRSLLDNFPFMVWLKDTKGRFLTVNKVFLDAVEAQSLDEVVGKTDLDFWASEYADVYIKQDKFVMDQQATAVNDEIIEISGHPRWFETFKSPVIVNDKVVGTVGFARDISDLKKSVNYEKFKSKMLELVVRETDLSKIFDEITRGLEQLNPELFCFIVLKPKNKNLLHVVSAPSLSDSCKDALKEIKISLGNGTVGSAAFLKQRVIVDDVMEHPYWAKYREVAKKSGIGSSWGEPIIGSSGQVLGVLGIYRAEPKMPNSYDLTVIEQSAHLISIAIEREESTSKIEHLAYYDEVTQLPNRRFLLEQLKRSVSMNQETGLNAALLYLDIDQFKVVNDSQGHDVGDMMLVEAASRLRSCLQAMDVVARVSGDEFAILLINLNENIIEAAKKAEDVADKVLKSLSKPYLLAKHKYHNTASIGITLFGRLKIDTEELLKQSDIAMYQAKKAGGNTFCFFDPKMQANITQLIGLETELRKAISLDQLQLYYQVQVDHLGHPFGAEALIRWIHPERGMISPAQFIPLAEDSGLIIPIGAWVIETACAQIKAWQNNHATKELTLSVNISAKQFRQSDFVKEVEDSIKKYGIDPMFLRLELTESMLLDSVEETVEHMNALGKIGVQFSLDDFGTGYSSLQYLKRLPLYQLKIDRSFVQDIVTDSHDRTIVRTIIAMAQSMYISVIAEGVETAEQKELLLTNGCRRYQGYFFGKPVPIDQFNAAIESTLQTSPIQ